MTEARRRRPLPAIICLAALTLLTALVWWRVINRDDAGSSAATSCSAASRTQLPRPDSIDLLVLNSTTKRGLAGNAATALRKQGFTVTQVANDTGHKPIVGIGEIRFSADQKAAATLLGYFFPTATPVPLTTNSPGKLIVSLGTKFKTVRTLAQVQAALKADHLSIAPKSITGAPDASTTCAPTP